MRTLQPLVIGVWITLASSLAAQDRIPWITDLRVARTLAEQQQRLVMLHFWSDTCAPCQRLERSVFNQPELIRVVSSGFIPVKINTTDAKDLAAYYKVREVPTDIIVDPSGREVFRTASPVDANTYISMLDGIRANVSVGRAAPNDSSVAAAASRAGTPWAAVNPAVGPNGAGLGAGGMSPGGMASPPSQPRSAYVENPYANAPQREAPQQTITQVSPPYTNPYVGPANTAPSLNSTQGVPPSPGSDLRNSPPWIGNATPPASTDRVAAAPPAPTQRPQSPAWAQSPESAAPAIAPNSPNAPVDYPPLNPGPPRAGTMPSDQRAMEQPSAWNTQNPSPPPATQQYASLAPSQDVTQARMPAGYPPLAMDGFCSVTLVEKTKWMKGDPRWGAVHRGRTYLFSSPAEQQAFLSAPDRYSPAISGFDAVRYVEAGQTVEGKREHGVFYRDRIYLFADEESLQRFGARPDFYIAATDQAAQRTGQAAPPRP